MKKIKSWVRIPSWWLVPTKDNGNPLLTEIKADNDLYGSLGCKIAALLIYISIAILAEEEEDKDGNIRCLRAEVTYDTLQNMTNLSRPLLSKGLQSLEELELVRINKNGRSSSYLLNGYDHGRGWCKLPAKALVKQIGSTGFYAIEPFKHFTKRSVYELYALKIFLYLLAVRGNDDNYSDPKIETIGKRTGITANRIKRTNSFLLTSGLLYEIQKSQEGKKNSPNRYLVSGYNDLTQRL